MVKQIRAHPLAFYFGLTFLLSWSIWVPMALDRYALLPVRLNPTYVLVGRMLGTFGPAVAAIVISLWTRGRPGVRALLGQLGRWRVGWGWFAAAALVYPTLVFVVAGLYRLLPGSAPLPFQPASVSSLVVTAIILTLTVLGEEIGWRGFALPHLQQRFPALQSSLVLGTIHTIWHLPFWTVLGELDAFGWPYWLISWAFVLALTIYLTWLMNNTGNSLLMAVILHGCYNLVSVGFLPITTVVPAYGIFTILAWLVAMVLIRRYGARRLARPPQPERLAISAA
jgi:membrane protease YdiL (CAAX protease family)